MRKMITPVAVICSTLAYSTAESCFAADYLTVEEAQKICFPAAHEFSVAHVVFSADHKKKIEELSGIPVTTRAQKIWKALDSNGKLLGWFVVDYVIGKHLLIDYAVAVSAEKKVLDVEILSYRESYGGEVRSAGWRKQFEGKTHSDAITLNDDITNIGGATLSSRHVTEGVKRILATIDVTQ